MTAPLSGQFDLGQMDAPGIYANTRDNIVPRGAMSLPQDKLIYNGRAVDYWNSIPAMIGGISDFAGYSTQTGVPMGTPAVEDELKVGGGPSKAEVPDYGGTSY
jgi:hypothetical protein